MMPNEYFSVFSGGLHIIDVIEYFSVFSGGLHIIDVIEPLNPKFVGCFSEDGYTHDAQCVIYQGPHTKHVGKEVDPDYILCRSKRAKWGKLKFEFTFNFIISAKNNEQ